MTTIGHAPGPTNPALAPAQSVCGEITDPAADIPVKRSRLGIPDVSSAEPVAAGLARIAPPPYQGPQGKRVFFFAQATTQNIQIEVTGA